MGTIDRASWPARISRLPIERSGGADEANRRGASARRQPRVRDLNLRPRRRGAGMSDRRPLGVWRMRLAAASALIVAAASPAVAQQKCWTDVTPNECPSGGWHVLQFKNSLQRRREDDQRLPQMDVRRIGGRGGPLSSVSPTAAGRRRFTPARAKMARSHYNYQYDGSVPNCPTQQQARRPSMGSSAFAVGRSYLTLRPIPATARGWRCR